MTLIVIVPVRGGSRGLPGKNLAELGGVPLWQRAVAQGKAAGADEVIVTIRDIEGMATVNGKMAQGLIDFFEACQPGFTVRQRLQAVRVVRVLEVVGESDKRPHGGRRTRRSDILTVIENRAVGRDETGIETFRGRAERDHAVGIGGAAQPEELGR